MKSDDTVGVFFLPVSQHDQKEAVGLKTASAVYLPRHDGILRPSSTISESFFFALLLLVIFVVSRIIRNGPRVIFEMVRNVLIIDDRNFTRESMLRRNVPFFWLINISIVALTAQLFLQRYGYHYVVDSWLFWKLALYTAIFWGVKNLLYRLIASVFFSVEKIRRWTTGNQVILCFFSFTLVPILLVSEAGVAIPLIVFYIWPMVFLIIPKLAHTIRGMNFFLMENGGYFYMILYLCALEILPLLLFIKGMFLIQ